MRSRAAGGLVIFGALLAACAPAAVADPSAASTRSAAPATATAPAPSATAVPIAGQLTPEASIAVRKPVFLAFDGTAVWVLSSTGDLTRIDPLTNTPGTPTPISSAWTWGGLSADADGVWVADFDANLVYRVDPVTAMVVATIPIEANPDGALVTPDGVWIAQHRGGSVTRIDPLTDKATTIAVGHTGPSGPQDIGFGAGSVWVSAGMATDSGIGGAVVRIDPRTNTVLATIAMPMTASACGRFAISDAAVWMDSCFDMPTLVRIDPATNKVVATIALGGYGGGPVLVDGIPWLIVKATDGGPDPARLVRIDPASNTIDLAISLGETFTGEPLMLALGAAWTADWNNDVVLRLPLAGFTR